MASMRRLVIFSIFALVTLNWIVESTERKFAPSYCVRFKLNCNSEEKKKHVCCLYPLPEADSNGILAQETDPEAGIPTSVPSGAVKIRPIKLPIREVVLSGAEEESEQHNEPKKLPKPPRNNLPVGQSSRSKVTTTTVSTSPPKRPRICIRLVVNCNSSPDHRCCKYPEEESEKQGEEADSKESLLNQEGDDAEEEEDQVGNVGVATKQETERRTNPSEVEQVHAKQKPQSDGSFQEEKDLHADGDGSGLTYESIINDEVRVVKEDEPYERIPAECFTTAFDCKADPAHRCCAYQ